MPEGDTIFRAARTLAHRLQGKMVRAFRSTVPALVFATLEGRTIERVEARGKNLLIVFDDGRVLASHMKMNGAWHVYRPGERWFLPAHRARVVLEVDGCVAVCFSAPVVELYTTQSRLEDARLAKLGPDILRSDFDPEEVLRRMRLEGAVELGVALLDQRMVAGIGNVYKSETLFLERRSPFLPLRAFDDGTLRGTLARAKSLMEQNLAPGSGLRTTRGSFTASRYWAYLREGQPCLECGTPIGMRRQGEARRSTYFCPRCQDVADDPRAVGHAGRPMRATGGR